MADNSQIASEEDEETVLAILDQWLAINHESEDGVKKPLFGEDVILARLLISEHVLVNSRHWMDADKDKVYVGAICSDVFAWGCADVDELPYNQIRPFYNMIIKDPKWGAAKWSILNCGMMPQKPVYDAMVKAGSWDEELQNAYLRDNPSWRKKEETQ